MDRAVSGIDGLDEVLGGGFPRPSAIALIGPRSARLSLFCIQFLMAGLRNREGAVYITTETPPSALRGEAEDFDIDLTKYEERGVLRFLDCHSLRYGLKTGMDSLALRDITDPTRFLDALYRIAGQIRDKAENGKIRLALDSLTGLIGVLKQNIVKSLYIVHRLHARLRLADAVGLATFYSRIHSIPIQVMMAQSADVILELKQKGAATYLRVRKMHRCACSTRWFRLKTTDSGLKVEKPR